MTAMVHQKKISGLQPQGAWSQDELKNNFEFA
jgi:hypothetical protein